MTGSAPLEVGGDATSSDVFERIRLDRRGLFAIGPFRTSMVEAELDAVIAVSTTNVTYTGGAYMFRPTLLTFVVTSADGRQGVVVNEADAYAYREYSWIGDVRSYRYHASIAEGNRFAVSLLVELLGDMGLGRSALGIEQAYLPAAYFRQLEEELPTALFAECAHVLEAARLIKTAGEIEVMRHACGCADRSIHSALTGARPMDTEKEVATEMQAAVLRLGADGLAQADVHAGIHSTVVHAPASAKPFEIGEVIHVDFGAIFGGYRTDLARNAVVGRPDPRKEAIYGALWEIQHELIEQLVPGAVASEIFAAGQRAFTKRRLTHPWGSLGHSIGLSIHEGFELSQDSQGVLATGMILNIEPSHIEPGDARYHIEDSVLITEDGPEVLSTCIDTRRMLEIL